MARYLEADTRRKFAIANKSLEACDEFLANQDVNAAVGDLAHYARNLLDYVYVPNCVEGTYQTVGRPAEGIPFIVADTHEKITVHRDINNAVHPWQWDRIREMIATIDSDEMTDESFELIKKWIFEISYEMNGEVHQVTMDDNVYAFVYAESSAIGIAPKNAKKQRLYGVETRPLIFGNSELLQREEARSNMFHELIHVLQFFRGDDAVFEPGNKRLWTTRGYELEAYAYQAAAEEAFYGVSVEHNTYGWTSMAVESVRRSIKSRRSKHPFNANQRIMDALNQRSITIEHQ